MVDTDHGRLAVSGVTEIAMTTYYRISARTTGTMLGTYAADSRAMALHAHATAAGYRSAEHMIDVLHGEELREWICDCARPEVDQTAVLTEALDVLAADMARGTNMVYELPARRSESGRPETFGLRDELVIEQLEVTADDIGALRDEAALAGDDEQVRLCDAALAGDDAAAERCHRVILAACVE